MPTVNGVLDNLSVPALKYTSKIARFVGCPPQDVRETDAVLYRWVILNDPHRTFLPPGIRAPERLEDTDACCGLLALSFFKTENQARRKHKKLTAKRPQLHLEFGSHIGAVSIRTSDGLLTQTGNHRDLYEYEDCNLTWSNPAQV